MVWMMSVNSQVHDDDGHGEKVAMQEANGMRAMDVLKTRCDKRAVHEAAGICEPLNRPLSCKETGETNAGGESCAMATARKIAKIQV
jgi:hypothetical protein